MTTTTRQAHWGLLVMVFVLVFNVGLLAQSRSAAVSPSPSPVARDLNTILADLMRASPATSQDLTDLQHQGGRLRWVTLWRGDKGQKAKMTAALRQRLRDCPPDAGTSAGDDGGTVFQSHARLSARCGSFENTRVPSSIVPKRSASMSLA